jgi:2-polyprenyl-3-methyl-5-hydroxy-6-metoxy-1,4-benzoquinol methylase
MKEQQVEKLLKVVKDNYQEIAGDFDETRKKPIWPELLKRVSNVKDGDSILDVGCGNGRLLEALKDKKINYLGIDNSENLIALAQKNYPDNEFVVGNILDLEELKEKYNLVISVAVLHHLPSFKLRQHALLQMLNATKDGGSVIFSVWRLWNNKKYRPLLLQNIWRKITGRYDLEISDLLFSWKNKDGQSVSQRYYHAFTKRELKKLIKAAGYNNFELITEQFNYWVIIKK